MSECSKVNDQELLVSKFKKDVKERPYFLRLLLVIDQFFNVLLWNGSQDETVSSHIGRRITENKAIWVERQLCKVLRKLEGSHCLKSKGE